MNKLFGVYLNPLSLHMLYCELLARIGFGCKIKIKNTLKCNMHCNYCSNVITTGKRPIFKNELNYKEWLKIIDNFPMKVRKVIIVGGEPFLRKDVLDLIQGIANRKIVVKVLTNLTYKRMNLIKPSPYIKLIATRHDSVNIKLFKSNLSICKKKGIRIKIYEFAQSKIYENSNTWHMATEEDDKGFVRRDFIFVPDGRFCFSLKEVYALR